MIYHLKLQLRKMSNYNSEGQLEELIISKVSLTKNFQLDSWPDSPALLNVRETNTTTIMLASSTFKTEKNFCLQKFILLQDANINSLTL